MIQSIEEDKGTHSKSRNCCSVSPASRTIPAIVRASIGLCRGTVRIRTPSVMTTCLPCRAILKPAFSYAFTALRCEMPGILPTIKPEFRLFEGPARQRVALRLLYIPGWRPLCLKAPLLQFCPVTSIRVNPGRKHCSLLLFRLAQRDISRFDDTPSTSIPAVLHHRSIDQKIPNPTSPPSPRQLH